MVGILGGLGPDATNQLCAEITALTPASKDQDHLRVITFSNPKIPDRTEFILRKGKSPVSEMRKTARTLENAGADFIIIPCNTAHYFVNDVQKSVNIPILNMIEETAKYISKNYPAIKTVGLLSTTGTINTKIYDGALKKYGIKVLKPSKKDQKTFVMEAIYGEKGIKAGYREYPDLLLKHAANNLLERGAKLVIAGCTEIGLVFKKTDFLVINPSNVIARVAVNRAKSIRTREDLLYEVIVDPYYFVKRKAVEPFHYIRDKTKELLEEE